MSVQAQFDEEALCKISIVHNAIKNADSFEANQMRNYALREIMH